MKLKITSNRVKHTLPVTEFGWKVWKNKGVLSWSQFGVAELVIDESGIDFNALAHQIRENAKAEFGGRWYRGAGFGIVLRIPEIAGDPMKFFDNIDLRNRLDGNIWQWIIMVFESERAAVGMHMWYHGYLHPVFLEISESFSNGGYEVITSDTETDPLAAKLQKIHKSLRPIKWLDSIIN